MAPPGSALRRLPGTACEGAVRCGCHGSGLEQAWRPGLLESLQRVGVEAPQAGRTTRTSAVLGELFGQWTAKYGSEPRIPPRASFRTLSGGCAKIGFKEGTTVPPCNNDLSFLIFTYLMGNSLKLLGSRNEIGPMLHAPAHWVGLMWAANRAGGDVAVTPSQMRGHSGGDERPTHTLWFPPKQHKTR